MESLDDLLKGLFRAEALPEDATMQTVAGWDSLTHMDLVAKIEQTYEIELTGNEIADMQDVASIRRILAQHGVT